MAIGLIVIGDEIMSGKHQDKHFSNILDILSQRGLSLSWAHYLGDEPAKIEALLKASMATDDIVFCCGGIGSTPDDYTRQCAANACGVPLKLHPEAMKIINERIVETAEDPLHPDYESPVNVRRIQMGEFPVGANIIPNPVNRFPGFSVGTHYFVPGFPQMATPMIAWALDTYHSNLFNQHPYEERSVFARGAVEAKMTPLMESITRSYPQVKIFSLPHMSPGKGGNYVEIGVKGNPSAVDVAFKALLVGLDALAIRYEESTK